MWGMDSNATNSSYAGCASDCGNSTLQYLGCNVTRDMSFTTNATNATNGTGATVVPRA